MKLSDLSDEALLESPSAVCGDGHRVMARLIAHLVVVEDRRLHLRAACSSMFEFCVRKLGMSEGAAFRRINAARLVGRFPQLLARIESGEVCLSTLVLVRDLLSEETLDELLGEVAHKTQREVEAIVARRAPKPDVPERVTRLRAPAAHPTATDPTPALLQTEEGVAPKPWSGGRPIAPLSEDRYKVQLTASAALRDKLERARALMRHKHPNGDLALVIEDALDALLDRLEREKLGKAKQPRPNSRPAKPGRIQRSTRREVFERDGEQCTFANESGERCASRSFLELDHIVPRGAGGSSEASNLRVRCRAHNGLYAEEFFGRTTVERAIDFRRRKSARDAAAKAQRCDSGDGAELAIRGLAAMGFAKTDAKRAVRVVLGQAPARPLVSVEHVLREALRVLT